VSGPRHRVGGRLRGHAFPLPSRLPSPRAPIVVLPHDRPRTLFGTVRSGSGWFPADPSANVPIWKSVPGPWPVRITGTPMAVLPSFLSDHHLRTAARRLVTAALAGNEPSDITARVSRPRPIDLRNPGVGPNLRPAPGSTSSLTIPRPPGCGARGGGGGGGPPPPAAIPPAYHLVRPVRLGILRNALSVPGLCVFTIAQTAS